MTGSRGFLKDQGASVATEYAMIAFAVVVLGAGLWPYVMGGTLDGMFRQISFSR